MNAARTRARTRAILPEDKSERRAAILRAAAGLLKQAPHGAFSVEALARRAGLAKGTVYLYFGTREEVLLAV
ncbi:MAG: helix-turn-helix transcriptional regulator, partial [Proteobacteria bacterium]|nr:helix-turn-helix transcriptional regulator [Pseudomonadota bacterium]